MAVRSYEVGLAPLRIREGDQDEELLRAHQLAGVALLLSGGWGAAMAAREELAPRQRRSALAATIACAGVGIAGTVRPRLFAHLQRGVRPIAPSLDAIGAIAGSRPAVSPMYLPSLILTGMGSSTLDRRTGRCLGRLTGLGYLAAVAASERRWHRQLIWNAGMWSAYSVAGLIGSEIGRLALDVRTLERARQRDRRVVEQPEAVKADLDRAAADASAVAAELERVLLEIARRPHGSAAPSVLESIAKIRRPVHHLEMAEQLISAARNETIDLRSGVEEMVQSFRAPAHLLGAQIETAFDLSNGAVFDARATLALLVTLKRAVDNAILGPRDGSPRRHDRGLSKITVGVAYTGDELRLSVTDDGGGVAPPETEWGTGLSEAQNRCRQLGGDVSLSQAQDGVRLVATVAAVPVQAPKDLVLDRAFTQRMEKMFERLLAELNLANTIQGVACLLSGESLTSGLLSAVGFVVIAGADAWAGTTRHRPFLISRLVAVGSLWPRGARPAGGWLGLKLLADAWRRGAATGPTAGATAALALQARRVRTSVAPPRIVENLTFPVLCLAFGVALRYADRRLRQIDAQQVGLRQRAEYIESLAPAIKAFHDYVSPLKSGGHWWGELEPADRTELERLRRALQGPTAALRSLIPTTDPLAEMQVHLAVRLAPVEISASGRQPVLDEARELPRLLVRARRVTELVGKADDIVDDLLDRFPRSFAGRTRLSRVHLHLEPHERDQWALWVRPVVRTAGPAAAAELRLHRAGRTAVASFSELPMGEDRPHVLHVDAIARAAE